MLVPDMLGAGDDAFQCGLLAAGTMWDLLTRRATVSGELPMLFDERGGSLTFGQCRTRAERLAAALSEQGIGSGTRVAWQLPSRISTVLVMMALARLGAVQAPVIPLYRQRETGAAVAAAGAEVIIVPGDWRDVDYAAMAKALPTSPRVITIGLEPPESGDLDALPPVPAEPGEVRWVYFTSGSTGLPKGAMHTDHSLLTAAYQWAARTRIGEDPDEMGSIVFPVAHVGGAVYLASMMTAGFPAVIMEAWQPGSSIEVLRRHRVTVAGVSTAFAASLLALQRQQPESEPLIPSLRLLKSGGAPCPPGVYHAVREELGVTLAPDYGMTEAPMICVSSPHDSPDQLADTDGRPLPGVEVRIVEDGAELPIGQDGEIQLRGPIVCRGYTDPAIGQEAFTADGWFRTGDRGHRRPDGHVEVTGRYKDLIIRKGENIAPLELETLLHEHPAVGAVAVIGLPDAARGERVCAVIKPRPGAVPPNLGEVVGFLRSAGLMPQKLPEQMALIDEFPMIGLGKIDKAALRRRFGGQGGGNGPADARL